tara:strand:+ start:9539 stop:11068 length:1530 start_codon:yes stop_codon:yes gene_type:complete
MTLYNPFFKFLNPRNSGLIVFKGGGGGASAEEVQTAVDSGTAQVTGAIGTASPSGTTTGNTVGFTTPEITDADGNVIGGGEQMTAGGKTVGVTGTVKGDTEQLIGGQSTTQDLINQRFDNFGGGGSTTNIVNEIDTTDLAKVDQVNQGFATSVANQGTIIGNQGSILGGQSNLAAGQTDILGNQTAMQTGIDAANTGINTANTALTGLGSAVGNVQTGVDTANTNLMNLGADVSQGFADQQTQVSDMQKAVLSGQVSMTDVLNAMRDEQTTQYGDLAANQATITNNIGGVQTGLDTLRTDQQKANTLADQSRAELAKTVTGGFDDVTENQAAQQNQAAKNAQVSASNQATIQQQAAPNTLATFGATAKQLASGQAANGEATPQQTDFLNRLATIKQILATQGNNLDESIRAEYATVANAFNDNGTLIAASIDVDGNQVRRGMDNADILITNTYNRQGALSNQKKSDLNQLMAALDTMGYRQVGSRSGNLSVPNMGLMSAQNNQPFIQQN